MSRSEFLDKLSELRAGNCESLPTPELAIMARTVNRLRRDGLARQCLQLGETAPDFEFIDAGDTVRSFYSVLGKGPAVINFFRGYWCPYCKTELEAYESIQSELDALGCTYFAVSPQRPETAAFSAGDYQMIFDRDNRIARLFGIVFSLDESEQALFSSWGLDLSEIHGVSQWQLPVPATFVICPDRTVGYEYVDVDFRARCCPDQLIEEVKSFCRC
ncbi:MAG: AhpC/TSA family protein [Gammaproteobacteria bacterium]|jgi:peroxiredoxin|nr:AhpC/TSA family protein [Gammaproteobacteria bacterium]MBT4491650.1 AhpC/TSA family protein [Gammaproteobacteria bacterium]MBT7369708.1 AhpC/TSA family protein [Gammaproteobacteria bacterium]